MATLTGLRLLPTYHERVWGGERLRPGPLPIGEAWIVYEHNRVADGPLVGRTLAEVRAAAGHTNVAVTSVYLHAAVDDDDEVGTLFRFE